MPEQFLNLLGHAFFCAMSNSCLTPCLAHDLRSFATGWRFMKSSTCSFLISPESRYYVSAVATLLEDSVDTVPRKVNTHFVRASFWHMIQAIARNFVTRYGLAPYTSLEICLPASKLAKANFSVCAWLVAYGKFRFF